MKSWLVDVQLTGLNLERCLRKCADQGIVLSAVRREGKTLYAMVREAQLDRLCSLAGDGGWQLTTGRRHGLGRALEALQRRWLLCLCAGGCAAAVMFSVQVLWRVELRDAGSYAGDIRCVLADMGIKPPMWKHDVDPAEVRELLEYRYPRVAWVECGWRGNTLLITLHQGVSAGEAVSVKGCCDVVASRDGVVDSVVTLAGTAAVKAGQTVRKGQVLIHGEERGADDTVHPVAARGIVMARVWDAAKVRMPSTERKTVYTGRRTERTAVCLPWFSLSMQEPAPYAQQDTALRVLPLGGLFIPLTVRRECCMEANISLQPRDQEQLKADAAVLALQKLREKIGLDDKLIDKWVEYSTIDDGVLQAVAYGERLLDIGVRGSSP